MKRLELLQEGSVFTCRPIAEAVKSEDGYLIEDTPLCGIRRKLMTTIITPPSPPTTTTVETDSTGSAIVGTIIGIALVAAIGYGIYAFSNGGPSTIIERNTDTTTSTVNTIPVEKPVLVPTPAPAPAPAPAAAPEVPEAPEAPAPSTAE